VLFELYLTGKMMKMEKDDDDDYDDEADFPEVYVKPCNREFYMQHKDEVS